MPGPMILGRVQAKAMGYIQFPQIWWPHTLNMFQHTYRNLCIHKIHAAKTTETTFQPQVSIHKTTPTESNQGKTRTADYRTSTTTHQMEHRLYTAQWQDTQTTNHQRIYPERV